MTGTTEQTEPTREQGDGASEGPVGRQCHLARPAALVSKSGEYTQWRSQL